MRRCLLHVPQRHPGIQLPGEAFDVGAADGEQHQEADTAPGGELAQVECVRFAYQPAIPGQEPGKESRSGSVKAGWIVTSAVDGAAVVIGHLPAGLEPGRRKAPAPCARFRRKWHYFSSQITQVRGSRFAVKFRNLLPYFRC